MGFENYICQYPPNLMKLQCENHWSGVSQLDIRYVLDNYIQRMEEEEERRNTSSML